MAGISSKTYDAYEDIESILLTGNEFCYFYRVNDCEGNAIE